MVQAGRVGILAQVMVMVIKVMEEVLMAIEGQEELRGDAADNVMDLYDRLCQ